MPPDEYIENDDPNLDPNLNPEGGEPGGEGGEGEAPSTYLRDLTEDDVYDRLSRVNEMPNHLNALESRLSGNHGQLAERLAALEKGLPTQTAFDMEKITKGLADYDPKLAELLGPLLQDALKTNALDETSLRPHLEPVQKQMQEYMNEQLVMSAYSPEALSEMIPPVKDGKFMPEGQRHKDFIDWYGQQGYQTQQALLQLGAPYINALRKFERWEEGRNKERADAAKGKNQRLENGRVPASSHRGSPQPTKKSLEEDFLAGFNEAQAEVAR